VKPEVLDFNPILTWLVAREKLLIFICLESFNFADEGKFSLFVFSTANITLEIN
jgi:hypothetical protein